MSPAQTRELIRLHRSGTHFIDDKTMSLRLNSTQFAPELLARDLEFHNAVAASSLPARLRHLITIRASQLNGCTFCLDMHVKQARMDGERELRVHLVAIWRESMLFEVRERAALAWCEALPRLAAKAFPMRSMNTPARTSARASGSN